MYKLVISRSYPVILIIRFILSFFALYILSFLNCPVYFLCHSSISLSDINVYFIQGVSDCWRVGKTDRGRKSQKKTQGRTWYFYQMVTQNWRALESQSLLFDLFKAFNLISRKLDIFSPKRPILVYTCTTCSELQSNISTMR